MASFPQLLMRSALAALFSLLVATGLLAGDIRFRQVELEARDVDGRRHDFTVELALSDAERMRGLMYRKSMPANHGMLFDFGDERLVTMWMRNTVLPLDMLFIDKEGVVKTVRERAVPFSEEIISSGENVRYVLELNAGTAARLRLEPGSSVNVRMLKNTE